MRVILKYEAEIGDEFMVPAGKICAFAWQRGEPQVWVEVDPNSMKFQTLMIWPTGYPFEEAGQEHVATAVSDDTVWHLYRVEE